MLEIENLTFLYEGATSTKVFHGFNFKSSKNGIVHLIGENGEGKTTLLRLISGLALPREGQILWHRQPLESHQVGLLSSQNNCSFFQLTGREAIKLYADLNYNQTYKTEYWWKALNKHPIFQKAIEQQYALCSTGMRQLINLAICLTKPAEIFLFDEPYKGLDTNAKNIFNQLVEEVSKRQLVILTSHEEIQFPNSKVKVFPLKNRRIQVA